MLEVARRLAARAPSRSILFLAFGAEELGLLGSWVFVDHPPLELRSISLVVNLDMVGRLRNDAVMIYGTRDSTLRAIVERANVDPRFNLTLVPASNRRSDDYPFGSRGVPALQITTGEHADYHRSGDTVDRIDLVGVERVTDFVERIARTAN